MQKAYKIWVGDNRPGDALLGHLEANQGNSIIKGTAKPAQPIGGKCMFANRSVVWGRRLIKGKPAHDRIVQPSDVDYTGQFEPMKWGSEGGTQINIRYKQGYDTLDYDYQVLQLNLPKYNDDLEEAYLDLPFGENNIFFDSEATKAEFLRLTHSNEDSIFKSPNSDNPMFHEIKLFDTTKNEVKEVDDSFEAMKIVKEANTIEKLRVLQGLVGRTEEIKVDAANENSLYETLILFARNRGPEFMSYINEYARKVSDLIERCKSFNALDTTKNGVIRAGIEKKEDLLKEVPAKGDDMIDWMFQNRLQPEVYEAIDKLIHISQKFKQ